MNPVRLFRLELRRLFRSRLTWLVMLLTLLSPAVGLYLYRPLYSTSATGYVTTTLGAYVANPALTGGLLGAIFFALLTIWELDRVKRGGVDALVHGAVSPLTEAILRVAALLCGSAVTLVLTLLVWLPYTVHAVGTVFDWKSYLLMYLLFQYGALPLAILFSAAVYQLTRRLDLSLVLFGAFAALSLTVWSENWQLSWLNPCVWSVSDAFSNDRLFRSVAYSRLTWLLALAGLWILSYLCIRRYGRGLWGSLAWNLRRIYRPMVAILLLICAGLAYVGQPFLDHSPAEMDYGYLFDVDYLETVTCSSRYTDVHPNPTTGELYGTAVFRLQNTGEACSIRFLLNPGYQVSSVRANGESVPFILGKALHRLRWLPTGVEPRVLHPGRHGDQLSVHGAGKRRVIPLSLRRLVPRRDAACGLGYYPARSHDSSSLWNRFLPAFAETSRWHQNLAYGGRGLPHDSLRWRLCLQGHPCGNGRTHRSFLLRPQTPTGDGSR